MPRVTGCSRVPDPPARMMPFKGRIAVMSRVVSFRLRAGGREAEPATIVADAVGLIPRAMLEVPLHGRFQAALKTVVRPPAEIATEPARIDGVAAIVSWTIGDELFEIEIARNPTVPHRRIAARWAQFLERRADAIDNREVCLLVVGTDVVVLPRARRTQHEHDRRAMVLHVQPVADVATVPIDRQRSSVQGVQNRQGDQLL